MRWIPLLLLGTCHHHQNPPIYPRPTVEVQWNHSCWRSSILVDAQPSTCHPTPDIVLDERHETIEKTISSLNVSSSNLAKAYALLTNYFCCNLLLALPLHLLTTLHSLQTIFVVTCCLLSPSSSHDTEKHLVTPNVQHLKHLMMSLKYFFSWFEDPKSSFFPL